MRRWSHLGYSNSQRMLLALVTPPASKSAPDQTDLAFAHRFRHRWLKALLL